MYGVTARTGGVADCLSDSVWKFLVSGSFQSSLTASSDSSATSIRRAGLPAPAHLRNITQSVGPGRHTE